MAIASRTTPDFIGIGAMRSATTWLSRCIEDHPQLFIPPSIKEVHFFDEPSPGAEQTQTRASNFEQGLDWYLDHFKMAGSDQRVGEFTPNYFSDPQSAHRIHELFPQVKLILILRDPVRRIISHHRYVSRNHEGIPTDIQEAIQTGDAQFRYIENSLYGKHLTRFLELFERKQLLILFYKDIQNQPEQVCRDLYDFLGVDATRRPSMLSEKVNTSEAVHSGKLLKTMRWAKQHIKRSALLRHSVERLGGVKLGRFINRRNRKSASGEPSEYPEDLIQELRPVFRADIELLENLLNRNLDEWK